MNFSVLISCYFRDNPQELLVALKSIWDEQTLKPNEIVIVKDGPLTAELDQVIAEFSGNAPVKIVALDQNEGLGKALAKGVQECSCEYIARMDSDDISVPERFAKQAAFMEADPEVVICGGMILEFKKNLNEIIGKRVLPVSDEEIRRFAHKRSPFNHVTVMFKKQAVIDAGNYEHLLSYEDFWLWCRMLANGGKCGNLPDTLVYVKAGENMLVRRRGWKLACSEVKLAWKMYKIGILSFCEMLRNLILRTTIRLMPVGILKVVYSHLREK